MQMMQCKKLNGGGGVAVIGEGIMLCVTEKHYSLSTADNNFNQDCRLSD